MGVSEIGAIQHANRVLLNGKADYGHMGKVIG